MRLETDRPYPSCGALVLLCSSVLVVLAAPVQAQVEEAATPAPAAAPAKTTSPTAGTPAAPTSTTEVVQRLDAVSNRLLTINDYLRKPAPDLAGITIALPDKSREAGTIIGGAEAMDPLQTDLVELAATVEKLRSLDRIFGKWRTRLQEEVSLLDPWRGQLRADAEFLRDAANPASQGPDGPDAVPEVLRSRLRQVAVDIEAIRQPLRRRVDAVVAADLRVSGLQTALRDLEAQLDAARVTRQAQTLALTAPPVWKPPKSLRLPLKLITQRFGTISDGVSDYFENRQSELTAFGLVLVVLLVAVARLRRSVLARGETEADQLLTRHPFAVALLVWMLIGPFLLLPQLPIGAGLIRALAAAVLLWQILPALVTPRELPPLNGLLLIAVAFLLQSVVLGEDWYGRLFTVLLGIVSFVAFRALARASDAVAGKRTLFQRGIRAVARVAPWVVAVGLAAEVVGARALGQQAIGGIVFLSLVLCSLLAVDAILCSIVDAWVAGPGGRWFGGVRRWPDVVRNRSRWITRLLLVIAFLNFLPKILPIFELAWQGIQHLLTTNVTVGDAQLSLGNILWFFVAVASALLLARLVRFILDEDVLPRLPLAIGAASAASRLIYYGLVVAGILFSLVASGVELSNLTLVVSALGVGVGFGLQNIVNNFVSGLILAFERPVREGDQITLGTMVGRVSEIGLRATRIRTFEGAEVIVPNANLIANEVTNWTLSDRTRRIDIAVGVDYGSDPVQVQALLLEAIKEQPSVAAYPEPATVFRGFGTSSLDFSLLFWTTDVDHRFAVETEARTRVLAALRSAGVSIPFPQLDVRVKDGVTLASSGPPAAGN